MLEPYSIIQDRASHGDVDRLAAEGALNDYIEATNDFGFLDEPVGLAAGGHVRADQRTQIPSPRMSKSCSRRCASASSPARISSATARATGTTRCSRSIRTMRDWMVSSWTVALLFQQLNRYAEVLTPGRARRRRRRSSTHLAAAMRARFQPLSLSATRRSRAMRFSSRAPTPELLLHPSDTRTGLNYSLLADDPARSSADCSRRNRRGITSAHPRASCCSPTACG